MPYQEEGPGSRCWWARASCGFFCSPGPGRAVELPGKRNKRGRMGRVEELLNQVEKQLRMDSQKLRATVLDDLGWDFRRYRFLADRIGVGFRSAPICPSIIQRWHYFAAASPAKPEAWPLYRGSSRKALGPKRRSKHGPRQAISEVPRVGETSCIVFALIRGGTGEGFFFLGQRSRSFPARGLPEGVGLDRDWQGTLECNRWKVPA